MVLCFTISTIRYSNNHWKVSLVWNPVSCPFEPLQHSTIRILFQLFQNQHKRHKIGFRRYSQKAVILVSPTPAPGPVVFYQFQMVRKMRSSSDIFLDIVVKFFYPGFFFLKEMLHKNLGRNGLIHFSSVVYFKQKPGIYFISTSNQIAGFCMKCNTGPKSVNE